MKRVAPSRRPSRTPFKHDLRAWLIAFAEKLGHNQSALTALLAKSCEFNPYFVVFILYWYCVPCQTRNEVSVEKAQRVATMATRVIRRLSGVAEDLGSLHQSMRFKDPFGYQILEHLKTDGLYSGERPPFDSMIKEVEKCTEHLKSLRKILKNLASMKRNPRVPLEVMLWEHLVGTVGISETRRLVPQLVHAADGAFGKESRAIDVAGAVEQAVGRFASLFPAEYERLKGKALRNKTKLPTEEVEYWESLSRHHKIIATYLDERFDKEILHAQDIWQAAPHETTKK